MPSTNGAHGDSAAMDVAHPQPQGSNPVQEVGFTAPDKEKP
jgi:hypothetical protein